MKIYIDNFATDLNHTNIILYIGDVNKTRLHDKLLSDRIKYMGRFPHVKQSGLMYVEDYELQDLMYDISHYLHEGYSIHPLHYDNDRFYIEAVDTFSRRKG